MLDDRDLAGRQPGDLVRVDVRADHLVPEVGEAGTGREAHVAGSDDGDPRHGGRTYRTASPPGPGQHARSPAGPVTTVARDAARAVRRRAAAGSGRSRTRAARSPARSASGSGSGTGSEVLAGLADWLIGRPLSAIVILLVAWIVATHRAPHGAQGHLQGRPRRPRHGGAGAAEGRRAGTRRRRRRSPPDGSGDVDRRRRHVDRRRSLIWVIAVLSCSASSSINLAPLIAGAGIAGIALGFGAQNLVKDCVAGLFMLIEDQYGIGDTVDLGVASGAVERITLRTTVAARPGRDGRGTSRTARSAASATAPSCGRSPCSTSSSPTTPTSPRTRQVVLDVARAVCRVRGLRRRRARRAGAARRRGRQPPTGSRCGCSCETDPGAQFRLQRALREAVKVGLDQAGVDGAATAATREPDPPTARARPGRSLRTSSTDGGSCHDLTPVRGDLCRRG